MLRAITKLRYSPPRRPQASRLQSSVATTPLSKSLYSPLQERDSCGVGFVAKLDGAAERRVVTNAIDMLERMHHRGGCGCDPNSGDGAGILSSIPDSFFRDITAGNFNLPEVGQYAIGQLFVPKSATRSTEAIQIARDTMENAISSRGLNVIGWRYVPTNNGDLGPTSLSTEPYIQQVFVENNRNLDSEAFERELLLARRRMELLSSRLHENPAYRPYICSLSSQTIVYKGQLHSGQLLGYYDDLKKDNFSSHMALVHSRFSTNTFPSWERAQPYRLLAHNGEINTLRGNKNWMEARGPILRSPYFGSETNALLPVVSDDLSDSGNVDAVAELLKSGSHRSLPEVMMLMIPEAYENRTNLTEERKALCEYNALQMEPWDGPAMMAFTDGKVLGASLDRNGLRPSRYFVTDDGMVVLSSEVGVTPGIDGATIKARERLEPGKMLMIDFEKGVIVDDRDLKEKFAKANPYKEWLRLNRIYLKDWVESNKNDTDVKDVQQTSNYDFTLTNRKLNMFGLTTDVMNMLLSQMVKTGKDALGSMGTDTPTAVLSNQPSQVSDFFKQLFAQVTNPPIDPIREAMVMSLECPVGPEHNLLETSQAHARKLILKSPILSTNALNALIDNEFRGWRASVVDICYERDIRNSIDVTMSQSDFTNVPESVGLDMVEALDRICKQVCNNIENGDSIIVLSDTDAGPNKLPIPSLVVAGAVHHHLLRTRQRCQVGLFMDCGDAVSVHDMCTLLGYGIDGIHPRMAYEGIAKMNNDGLISAVSGDLNTTTTNDPSKCFAQYVKALEGGILKVMSKMGISTLRSYKGAQIFEIVGLSDNVVDRCFSGTPSRIGGASWDALHVDAVRKRQSAYPEFKSIEDDFTKSINVRNSGSFHSIPNGEVHYNDPHGMTMLQESARNDSRKAFQKYSNHVNNLNSKVTLRGLMDFVSDSEYNVDIEDVEPVEEIVKRFCSGAMSLGSISSEAHETLAIAMNRLGGKSNTGEGGEDPSRFHTFDENGDTKRSAIKQIASGRFGVTSNYLTNADQLQIKIAQGAKPGEGGELPGNKVHGLISETRRVTPGVGLISPPPHHDIYSIEDLAQLIHDAKWANPKAVVSTKLVSEVGVGVVASGCVKAKSDHLTISGGDGGTGAAAWTGIKHAGLPWELGLAETQQTLVLNDLRSRVTLQADGQLKTGRDVVIAALLGAEEFAFSTAPLIAMGCIMMRKCHLNTCPVGIATQDPELRAKFAGTPEHVVNFLWMLAEDVREYMAMLGFRTFNEMVGRSDKLEINKKNLNYKSRDLDLSALLLNAGTLNASAPVYRTMEQDHELEDALDNDLINLSMNVLEGKDNTVTINLPITNLDRSTGATLSHEISKRFGDVGLPDNSIIVNVNGHCGQSFGFTLAKGITMHLEGEANDGCGKSLSGGHLIVTPKSEHLKRDDFIPENNIIVGNVALYGATSGEAYFNGIAGERFAVRNSGSIAVVEGVGDHGCEYMTGGIVAVLGKTGNNFGAGMSGGRAFVYDIDGKFEERVNKEMVLLEKPDVWDDGEEEELKYLILKQNKKTGSQIAGRILNNWSDAKNQFVKVINPEYKIAIAKQKTKKRITFYEHLCANENDGQIEEAKKAVV
jgi:glutamate synthase (NADPH/NADH)